MTTRQRALAQPQGRVRLKPGTLGTGRYYRIVLRPKEQFASFKTQDIGRRGHTLRLAGRRQSGSWDTEAFLVSKQDAHIEADRLVPNDPKTRELFRGQLSTVPRHVRGDIFIARPRKNVPEKAKPTRAQKRARSENIKKAQKARRSSPS